MRGRAAGLTDGIVNGGQGDHGDADRQVDVERPPPRQMVGEQTAGQRSETVVTPNTAPRAPWYLPRSRSGMMSAITAVAVTIRPPAPRP